MNCSNLMGQVQGVVGKWLERTKVRLLLDPEGVTEGWRGLPWQNVVTVQREIGPISRELPARGVQQEKPSRGCQPPPKGRLGLILGLLAERTADPVAAVAGSLERVPAETPVLIFFSFGPTERSSRVEQVLMADLYSVFGAKKGFGVTVITRGLVRDESDGLWAVQFIHDGEPLGPLADGRSFIRGPRQSLGLCMIVQDAEPMLWRVLRPLGPLLEQAVFVDTGSGQPQRLREVLRWFAAEWPAIDVQVVEGTHPYYCLDCKERHPVGEERRGHRFAGFETPRNEGLERMRTDWICWPDADEELLNPTALPKFLRPNCYNGYGLRLHHFSAVPPEATKIDMPCKLFRRNAGARFTGILHEHPETGINRGVQPSVVLGDVDLAHVGYLTENIRRQRFFRNWPLMVADQERYPERRLGQFLYLRDLTHNARYEIERSGGVLTPAARAYCLEAVRRFREQFATDASPYSLDALGYYSDALRMLGEGADLEVTVKATKPEIGNAAAGTAIRGRFRDGAEAAAFLTGHVQAVLSGLTGKWVS